MMKIFFFVFSILFFTLPSFAQNRDIDSLYNCLKNTANDTARLKALDDLSWRLTTFGLYDDAIKYVNEGLALCYKMGNKDYSLSFRNTQALIYNGQEKYSKALENYFESLKLIEKSSDTMGIAALFNNIGIVYKNKGDNAKALDYYSKALKLEEQAADYPGVASAYQNIGVIYEAMHNYSKALQNYTEAIKIFNKYGYKQSCAGILMGMGNLYFLQFDYDHALESYSQSMIISEELGDKNGLAQSCIQIGNTYIKLKKFNEAKQYLEKGILLAKEIRSNRRLKESYGIFSEMDSVMGNYREALAHYKMSLIYRDSLNEEEDSKEFVRTEMKHEFEIKQEEEKAEQDKKDALTNIKLYSSAAAGGLMLILLLVSFRAYRSKKTAHAEITNKNKVIEEKNKEITDSINYAEKIQNAYYGDIDKIKTLIPQWWVFIEPKNIVSGDFFWAKIVGNKVIFALGDCTGHGVPGAMMSVLAMEKLDRVVLEKQIIKPAEVLSQLNKEIKRTLNQNNENVEIKDGMDVAFCLFDLTNNTLEYSGANRPLYHFRNGVLNELAPTKNSIAGFTDDDQVFASHAINFVQGDAFYLFTDGYADQFGGEKGKKFSTKRFKELLISMQHIEMTKQLSILKNNIIEWKGHKDMEGNTYEQTDDISVLGIKI